jgi:hypothetical protein
VTARTTVPANARAVTVTARATANATARATAATETSNHPSGRLATGGTPMKSLILLALFGALAFAQPAALQIQEIRGTIASVNLVAGNMPSITVNVDGGRRSTVRLGSIRYLIANDFNPKSGQPVVVRGFPQPGVDLVAISVELPKTRQKLTLRDEQGRPLWRGGPPPL